MGGCAVKSIPQVIETDPKQNFNLVAFTRTWSQSEQLLSHRATSGAFDTSAVPEALLTSTEHWTKVTGCLAPHSQMEFEEKYSVLSPKGKSSCWTFAKSCKKGYKPSTENQDDFAILTCDDSLVAGVFDGHGMNGHFVSHYVQTYLPQVLAQKLSEKQLLTKQVWETAFLDCQRKVEEAGGNKAFDCVLSGTTATIAVVSEGKLVVGNVGDSVAFLVQTDGEIIEMTTSHRPDLPQERERIEQKGGVVRSLLGDPTPRLCLRHKDAPGLAMSRSLGDTLSKDIGASAKPDLYEHTLTPQDEFILLGSDGIWDFIDPLEAAKIVKSLGKAEVSSAAEAITKLAWSRWVAEEIDYVDDLTVIIVYLPSE